MTQPQEATHKKILVVEDDAAFGNFLLELLQGKGYSTTLAPDGEIGMDRYQDLHPDLVLTDIYMPHREGIGLINQIRSHDIATPIIVMSGGTPKHGRSYLHAATALGANAALTKPFTSADLLQLIRSLLGER